MSQNIVAIDGLHIGIEAELLLQAITFEEDRDIPNLKTLAYMATASCRDNAPNGAAGMHEEVAIDDVDNEGDENRFTEWVLTDDETIEPAPYNPDNSPRQCMHLFAVTFVFNSCEGFWMPIMILSGPLELVSPILEFTNDSNFRQKVEDLWDHLKANTKINVNESCGRQL
jgi:hypothetical protein